LQATRDPAAIDLAGEGGLGAAMNEPKVTTFFYGSYMNRNVLRDKNLQPERLEVARLPGYDISIRPLANLVASDEHTVYGVLEPLTHSELERLYRHAREVLGGIYLPHPVLVFTRSGQIEPALCYIAPALTPAPADPAYTQQILEPAREYGFPAWYLRRLESFLG
jgi:hypothetical protein